MRRVEAGRPFRRAYREVASDLKDGQGFVPPSASQILARRKSTGGLGNLGFPELKQRIQKAQRWGTRERRRFETAMGKLGGSSRPPVRQSGRSR
jgi:hypothetical protein